MEDNLKYLQNGRDLKYFQVSRKPRFLLHNRRQPRLISKWRMTLNMLKIDNGIFEPEEPNDFKNKMKH